MNNLADRVIAANSAEDDNRDEGPLVDDIGFPLPKPDTEKAWCEYLTARVLYLNNRMYQYHGMLWLDHRPIKENKNSYYRLARYTKQITDPQCQYVWMRLREIVPELDPDVISVLPGLTFNMRTGEVKDEEVWTITPWGEKGKK